MRDLDNVFATVNAVVSTGQKMERKNKEQKSDNTSKSIVRYEFLEAIVRLSLRLFPDSETGLEAIRKTCEDFILPQCKSDWNLDDFRRNHMYLEGVHYVGVAFCCLFVCLFVCLPCVLMFLFSLLFFFAYSFLLALLLDSQR